MYSITALFCAKGRGAMNATAETLDLAHDKTSNLKSQALSGSNYQPQSEMIYNGY